MMFTFYLILPLVTIVLADIVRRYSVRLPEGAIVAVQGDPYTDVNSRRYPLGQVKTEPTEDDHPNRKTYTE